ncbi:hypothetical protein [Caballeronia sp. GAFFF3]|uniref:hypothetical protein n=1 Tax=Caballeronia sp. GAFFF3 TaxID=2921759 RepID=UPI00202967B0|nr:hypothetical protein [Caballeronia sp. GAFFF3]
MNFMSLFPFRRPALSARTATIGSARRLVVAAFGFAALLGASLNRLNAHLRDLCNRRRPERRGIIRPCAANGRANGEKGCRNHQEILDVALFHRYLLLTACVQLAFGSQNVLKKKDGTGFPEAPF